MQLEISGLKNMRIEIERPKLYLRLYNMITLIVNVSLV